jgi:dephospho-CoA kinase
MGKADNLITAGLTGGIATGKSTVSGFLEKMGAVIIDADRIARQAVQKGTAAWQRILAHFGPAVLTDAGEINRPYLAEIVFARPREKQVLESIVHPFVFEQIRKETRSIAQINPETVIVQDVPLLIESGMYQKQSLIILVYAPESVQLERLIRRNGFSPEEALARIRAQMPIEDKRRFAHMVIDNSKTISDTEAQTEALYRLLKQRVERRLSSEPPVDRFC